MGANTFKTSDKLIKSVTVTDVGVVLGERKRSLSKAGGATIPYASIVSLGTEQTKPMGNQNLLISTAAGTTAIRMNQRQAGAAQQAIAAAMNTAPVQHPPPEMTVPSSTADELAKLAALRDQGVLSDDEFEAQKARLLGQS